jgi:hypothetical protein
MRKNLTGLAIVGVVAVIAASGSALAAGAVGKQRRHRTVVVRTRAGAARARADIAEPAGVIRLFRVVVPAGTRVRVTAVIPGIAGVATSVPAFRSDPSETCDAGARVITCVQGVQWCPMPAAVWHIRVRKLAGPAGRVRIDFVVGPARSSA